VVQPLLDVMGRLTMHVGPPGTGNRIKLLHNALGAVNAVAVAESLALCDKVGVDPRTYYEVVKNGGGMAYSGSTSTAGCCGSPRELRPDVHARAMLKDVTLATEMAGALSPTSRSSARRWAPTGRASAAAPAARTSPRSPTPSRTASATLSGSDVDRNKNGVRASFDFPPENQSAGLTPTLAFRAGRPCAGGGRGGA
jgi:hypothetical protein